MRKVFFYIIVFLASFQWANAQQQLTDAFNYSNGSNLQSNGWSTSGFPIQNPILVDSPGLSFSGYILSGSGNAAYLHNTGTEYYKAGLTSVNTGSVYAAYNYRVDTAKTGDYCLGMHVMNGPGTFYGRVYVRAGANGYYKLGLSKNNDIARYGSDSFPIGTVGMIVVKYSFFTGSNTNDTAYMYHFTSSFPSTEPATPYLKANGTGSFDATNIGMVGLRQGTVTTAPSLMVDGIRLAQTWTDLNTTTINKPGPLQFIFVTNITANTARIQFSKHAAYNRNLHNVLLFLKKGDTIMAGVPTRSVYHYVADSNFSGSGTPFEYDTAVCVYNGDSNLVNIVGLAPSTRYRVIGYSVNESDSIYSDGLMSAVFTTTTTAPGQAFGLTFTANSTTTATISWIKNTNYNNTNHTTVVFVKELSSITTGTNTWNPNNYDPDTIFTGGTGTPYQNDVASKCVYNGDGTSVKVYALKPGTRYYVYLLGANVFDSSYSAGTTANGIMPTGGPGVPTTVRFNAKLENNSTITWNKPTGYNNATHTILVFMRKDTFNYVFPAATLDPSNYTADSNFVGNGTPFEGDTASTCVYNGDGNSVGITNLLLNTRYYVLIYCVKTDSSLYSLPTFLNQRTMVDSVTNPKFLGASATSATISWTNPANYTPGTHITLVFVKAGSPTTVNTPTKTVTGYTANANFGAGTKYQHDASSFCVYRATGTSVTVNNLQFGVTYHAVIFVVRFTDSLYTRYNTCFGGTLDAPPVHDIGPLVRTVATNGVIDSNNVRATIRGTVYGGNNRTLGVQFVLRDATGGITVYHTTKNFGYTVLEGDSLEVVGTASQLNGLAIMTTLDTIRKIDVNATLKFPTEVQKLDETTENDLVVFTRAAFLTPQTNWPTNGTVQAINQYNGDTFSIRVYSTSSLSGKPAPSGEFSIAGLGSQATTLPTAPYPYTNYRIVPRNTYDITFNTGDTIANFQILNPGSTVPTILLDGDSSQTWSVTSSSAGIIRGVGNVTYNLLLDESSGDFTSPMLLAPSNNTGLDTVATLTYGQILNSLIPALNPGDSMIVRVTMTSTFNSIVKMADQKRLVIFKLSKPTTGINKADKLSFVIYPNPAGNTLNVQTSQRITKLSLVDLQGKLIVEAYNNTSVDVSELSNGIYLLQIETPDGIDFRRVQIQH